MPFPTYLKGYVSYVVSEFGMVNLLGKNIEERAMAMISLAHPDFRDELFHDAQQAGIIDRNRTLTESLFGIYPARMEETRKFGDQQVTFRPAKAVDGPYPGIFSSCLINCPTKWKLPLKAAYWCLSVISKKRFSGAKTNKYTTPLPNPADNQTPYMKLRLAGTVTPPEADDKP